MTIVSNGRGGLLLSLALASFAWQLCAARAGGGLLTDDKPVQSMNVGGHKRINMAKVYLRATGINKFEWISNPERATADTRESMEVTLKQLKGAELEQAQRKTQQAEPGWIISREGADGLPDLTEIVTQDGCRILREAGPPDFLLCAYYAGYNQRYFDGSLLEMPVFWAKTISLPDGKHPMALYVSEESPVKRYIVLDEKLLGIFPLERLCLLHEMVHVKIAPVSGHGEEFIAEFKRVLDASHWEEMGCIDSPRLQGPA